MAVQVKRQKFALPFPLSLVRIIEELLQRSTSDSDLEY
jgi:hypothetical protein